MQRFYDLLAESQGFVHQPPLLIEDQSTPLNSNLQNEGVAVNRTVSSYTGKVCAVKRPRNLHPILPFQYRVAHGMYNTCFKKFI